jgi:hypothetical protein
MMRACVLLAVVAMVPACGPNPGFKIRGGSGAEETESGTGGSSGGEGTTGDPVCTPRALVDVDDACTDWRPAPIPTPDLTDTPMLAGYPCTEPVELLAIRDGDFLYETTACDQPYDPDSSIGLAAVLVFSGLEDLPPPDGECVRLWHVGKFLEDGATCASAAYGFWDGEGDQALRFAFSSADVPSPFPAADGLTAAVADDDLCTVADNAAFCPDNNVRWKSVHFEFGRCSLDAVNGEQWTDIIVGGIDYQLDLYRAFDCVGNGSPQNQYGWFLRRAP